jgi:hypothetical protein
MNILIKTIFGFFAIVLHSTIWAQSPCPKTGSAINNKTQSCYTQPTEYYMTIYKVGLCTTQPTAPSANSPADFSSCTTVYENTSGSRMQIVKGTSSALLGGTMTRPANSNYPYGYVIVAPQFEIKTSSKFLSATPALGGGSGDTCWSTAGTAYVIPTTPPTYAKCGYSIGNDNDVTIQKMNSLGPTQTYSASFPTSAGQVSAFLVKNDLTLGSTAAPGSMGDITKMIGVAPMNLAVTASTTTMNTSYDVSNGTTVIFANVNGTDTLVYFGGGPFAVLMTLQ